MPNRRIVERLSAPHYGSNGDPLILVAQGSSRDLNPSLPQAEIDVEYDVDVAQLQVKIAEAGLYPTLALQGSVQQLQLIGSEFTLKLFNSAVQTRLTVPFYRGGSEYSAIRESKEALATSASILIKCVIRSEPMWSSIGVSSKPPRRKRRRPSGR